MSDARRAALRVAAIYAIVAGGWILFSDALVSLLPDGPEERIQTFKGLIFVAITALTLYAAVIRWSEDTNREARRSASLGRMLSQVVGTAPVGIVLLSGDGAITYLNPTAEALLGVASEDVVGLRFEELGVVEGADGVVRTGELLATGALDGLRLRGPQDDEARAVIARAAAVDELVPGSGWVVALADVTDAHAARVRADRLAEGYRFLSEAAIAMSKAGDQRALLNELCKHAVEDAGFAGAWAFFGEAERPEVSENVFVGSGESTRNAARLLMEAYAPDGQLSSRLVDGEIIVSNDIGRDPRSPWYSAAQEDGFGSVASLAVSAPGGLVISLTLFARPTGYFRTDQIALLKSLRGSLGFAVDRIALDRQRLEVEDALERSERSYRDLFDRHPQPMWVYDTDSLAFLAVNDAAVAKYGYSRDEFMNMTIKDIRPKGDVPRLLGNVMQVDGFDDAGIWTHVDKSGREFPVHVYSHVTDWRGHHAELVMVMEVAHVE